MPKIFGIDVAGLVHSNLKGKLFAGTLSRTENKVTTNYVFEGVPGEDASARDRQATLKSNSNSITIIAKSISPTTVPRVRDRIVLLDKTYDINAVDTDPAEATYICAVTKIL